MERRRENLTEGLAECYPRGCTNRTEGKGKDDLTLFSMQRLGILHGLTAGKTQS